MRAGKTILAFLGVLAVTGLALAVDKPADKKKGGAKPTPAASASSAPKKKKAPEPEPEPDPEPEPPEKKEAPPERREGVTVGVAGLAGLVFSDANTDSNLKLISPSFGLSVPVDVPINELFSLRLEPAFSTFSRQAVVRVPLTVDATQTPTVVTLQDITNRTRVLAFDLRSQLAFALSTDVALRAGLFAGYGAASTGAASCASDSRRGGASYGLTLSPIAVRLAGHLEVGALLEMRWATIPRCDVPLRDAFVVQTGTKATFTPQTYAQSLRVFQGALQLGYVF
jgi:hypothetical protein